MGLGRRAKPQKTQFLPAAKPAGLWLLGVVLVVVLVVVVLVLVDHLEIY